MNCPKSTCIGVALIGFNELYLKRGDHKGKRDMEEGIQEELEGEREGEYNQNTSYACIELPKDG